MSRNPLTTTKDGSLILIPDVDESVEAIPAGSYSKDKASEDCSYLFGHRSRSTLMQETRLDTNAKTP